MTAQNRADALLAPSDQDRITEAVTAIIEQRAVIEHAVGMLMIIYDITADQAFEVLKWRSQNGNVKVRTLAQTLVSELPVTARNRTTDLRLACEAVLFSPNAHDGDSESLPKTVC